MGRKVVALILAIIVGICSLGFTCWLGLAVLVLTVGQPNEVELDVLLAASRAATGVTNGSRTRRRR